MLTGTRHQRVAFLVACRSPGPVVAGPGRPSSTGCSTSQAAQQTWRLGEASNLGSCIRVSAGRRMHAVLLQPEAIHSRLHVIVAKRHVIFNYPGRYLPRQLGQS